MQQFKDNWPVPSALCVFRAITGLIFLGYVMDAATANGEWIKCYMKDDVFVPDAIEAFQYVLNDCDGFYFISPKTE